MYYTHSIVIHIKDCDANVKIDDIGFSARAKNRLAYGGIETLQELLRLEEYEVLRIEGLGRLALNEIKEELLRIGYLWGSHRVVPPKGYEDHLGCYSGSYHEVEKILTPREAHVFSAKKCGFPVSKIAKDMGVTPATCYNVLKKANAKINRNVAE